MPNQAIEQIKQAEEQGAILCRAAEERAADMRAQTKKSGLAHCAEVERATRAEYAAKLATAREGAAEQDARIRRRAEAEAEALKATARERMDEAVSLIVWGIVEKCQ